MDWNLERLLRDVIGSEILLIPCGIRVAVISEGSLELKPIGYLVLKLTAEMTGSAISPVVRVVLQARLDSTDVGTF